MIADIPSRTASQANFVLHLADIKPEDLRVTAFSGVEGLSELFDIRVELTSELDNLPLHDLLGAACRLDIHSADGVRYLSGIARALTRVGEGVHQTHYRLEIVPTQWLLTRRYGSRIFQEPVCGDMSVPGIIRKVLETAGLPARAFRFALQSEHAARDYVVQYRETDFDFISRLMEREGLFYFFEHSPEGHTMVIADGPVAHVPNPLCHEFKYRQQDGLEVLKEYVFAVRDRQTVQSGRCSLDDFDFKRPAVELMTTATADERTALAIAEFPGQYIDKAVGQALARVRLEEQNCGKRQLEMATSARGLMPGYRFELTDHPRAEYNRQYVITRVSHRATEAAAAKHEAGRQASNAYCAELCALPSDIPFRPARRTPWPAVRGSQTALVVGPEGEEIYTDAYGRVKVQFHWDHAGCYNENSSCWIRVSQGSAGGMYGMMFLPRVGHEVIVDHLEGDPDRPIITGRVYNGDLMPPYALPEHKTRSTIKTHSSPGGGGTNEIRFEDKKGSEQLLLFAQSALHLRSGGNCVETVGWERHTTVERETRELFKKQKHTEIKLDLIEKIGGSKSLTVHGAVAEDFKANHSEACGSYYLKAEKGEVVIESVKGITLSVGGNFIRIDPAGVHVMGTIINLNSGGMAGKGVLEMPEIPLTPYLADSVKPGYDKRYMCEFDATEGIETSQLTPPPSEPETETPTSWIEIELVDEAGQPWPNEPYEIMKPDGKIQRGTLDQQGQAHVELKAAGQCQIRFPRLDKAAWERA